ncbi:MAG TPA: Crp/Fnr family transcriptional regulator [Kouleothrix sp.]|uniref:Crp/Fnr family transcriptional regulator n=1 Tax=Kouleothrix sp. TaxID=2779161 RepID=UPI002CDFEF4C|nr:Crp/Fnr family transcriptional regulator [Kouleothrix sp.]HRC76164.1 Crp/Fnr family transcriptional regulator [Kouleothrix sp.]
MAVVSNLATLAEMPLFRDLAPEQLARVNDLLRRKTFPAGTNLISAEEPGEVVYIIFEGTVKVYVTQADGNDVIIAFGGPGDIEGEMSVIDSTSRSANIVTQEQTTVLWLDRLNFQECLRAMPQITYNLLRIMSDRLRLANERIQALCALDVYGRVARQMLAFGRQYGKTNQQGEIIIPIRLTQSDIASLVGATRERVNQVIASFKGRSYISVDRNYRITIHDAAALERQIQ